MADSKNQKIRDQGELGSSAGHAVRSALVHLIKRDSNMPKKGFLYLKKGPKL